MNANTRRSTSMSHQRYVLFVSAKHLNILLDPKQRGWLIHQAKVSLRLAIECREEPKNVKPVSNGDDDDFLLENQLERIDFEGTSVGEVARVKVSDYSVATWRSRAWRKRRKIENQLKHGLGDICNFRFRLSPIYECLLALTFRP